MIQPFLRKLGGALCLAVLVLALAGCGRRGPLELPPGTPDSQAATPAATQPTATADAAATTASGTSPGQAAKPAKPPATTPAYKSFFLDPLVN